MPLADTAEKQPGSVILGLRKMLAEPRLRGIDVDSPEFVEMHRRILREKPLMRDVFRELYQAVLQADERFLTAPGVRVELGAGSSFFRDYLPGLISTDIKVVPQLNAVVDAQNLPFRKNSVRAYYGIDCFHHFPDPAKFFEQLVALLAPGAGCVLIEPYHGPVAQTLFTRLFDSERFDKNDAGWTNANAGPMRGANQALSWIVFKRDRTAFEKRFPSLEIVLQKPMTNHLRYFLSGGLNFRSLVPDSLRGAVRFVETMAAPLARWTALHHMIVIRKR